MVFNMKRAAVYIFLHNYDKPVPSRTMSEIVREMANSAKNKAKTAMRPFMSTTSMTREPGPMADECRL